MKMLFMSGYAENAVIQKEVLRKGDPFLQKPFKRRDLLLKVREVLGSAP